MGQRRRLVALTGWALVAGCSAGPSPCYDPVLADSPVSCSEARVRRLGHSPYTAEQFNAQVAQSRPSLVLDDEFAYWSDIGGRVLRTPKAGGATVELLADHGCSVAALAIDDTALYVAENCRTGDDPFTFDVEFTLMRLDPETGATTDLVIAPFAQGVAVVAHDSKVYFGMGTTGQTFVRAISRDGPLEGPADTFRPYAVLDFPYGTALPLVVSGAEVLVVDRVDSAVLALGATPADAPTSRYVHDRTIASLVDAGGSLYLTDSHLVGTQLATRAFRVDGGTSSILYDDTQLQHVVGDERGVYAAGDLEVEPRVWGRFYELVGADGGGVATPVLRAAGITRVSALALDATHVYVVHNFSRIESAIDLVAVSR